MAVSKKRIWGWMAFDWASQPFYTLGLTFVFGPYFAAVATQYYMGTGMGEEAADAQSQSIWFLGQTVAGILIALSAPVLGAFADASGRKVPWIAFFSIIYLAATLSLWRMTPDGSFLLWSLVIFYVAFFAAETILNFVNAILPSLGNEKEIGRISGSGASFGYWGGVLALMIMLALFVESPETGLTLLGGAPILGLDASQMEGTRSVGPFIAIWYVIFMVPFFLWVRDERPPVNRRKTPPISAVISTIKSLTKRRSLGAFLLGSMCYRDALNAIYAAGGVYAALVLNWTTIQIGVFGIIAAISAAILTWLGGLADARYGPKPVILVAIWWLIGVTVIIIFMKPTGILGIPFTSPQTADFIFYICGMIIGGAGGSIYSASRSMMVRHTDPDRPAEAFGLFALSGKATAFLAPMLIAIFTAVSGSAQIGYVPVLFLFILGLILLRWVNKDGDRAEWSGSQQPLPSS